MNERMNAHMIGQMKEMEILLTFIVLIQLMDLYVLSPQLSVVFPLLSIKTHF
jgi:hypothetical protein